MKEKEIKDYIKAGEILKQVKDYARSIIKKEVLLKDIAEKVESKIIELNGDIAFPINLSINDIAAHYTPTLNDDSVAKGLIKVDIGVHYNGFIADSAFSIDLENNELNKKLIESAQKALENAIKIVKEKKQKTTFSEIGEEIQKTISSDGFSSVINLSGHSLEQYTIHAGQTIPNHKNDNDNELGIGGFAIEPFSTSGIGLIYEGGPSNIYVIIPSSANRPIRDPTAREIIKFIFEKKQTLPFSLREIQKNLNLSEARARISLRNLEQTGIIHEYPQLIEKTHKPVAQAEHTLIITKEKVIITT